MAQQIPAWLAADGSMHKTYQEAEDHDTKAALTKWACEKNAKGLPFDQLVSALVADWDISRRGEPPTLYMQPLHAEPEPLHVSV